MGLADLFRRDTVKDPFGGEDGFDGESRFAGKGPKIALAASGALFLLLVGGVTAVVLTGEEAAPPPMMGSLSDLQVVEDTAEAPHDAPAAPGAAKAPVVADATAATDKSVERRPWLNANTAPADNAPRPGMGAKPAAPPAPPAKNRGGHASAPDADGAVGKTRSADSDAARERGYQADRTAAACCKTRRSPCSEARRK